MSRALKLPEWQVMWVRDAVAARCGLYLGGPHEAYLSAQVAKRMEEMQVNFADYARMLQESPTGAGELQTLIERLCIHETGFLRDPSHFQAVARFVLPQLAREAQRCGRQRLRLVSAGCSTGQEAYSLAMMVHEGRTLLGEIEAEVVGFDVSGDVIERAARGVYPAREVMNLSAWRRQHYFRPVGTEYAVIPALQRAVRWLRWNLTGGLPLTQVDLIFCRNVLIYFQEPQRDAVVHNLASALRRGGFLVAGYADSLQAYRDILDPIRVSGAVVFRRVGRADVVQNTSTAAASRRSVAAAGNQGGS
jgi:chemotaxis methyl-accepting protein methylase